MERDNLNELQKRLKKERINARIVGSILFPIVLMENIDFYETDDNEGKKIMENVINKINVGLGDALIDGIKSEYGKRNKELNKCEKKYKKETSKIEKLKKEL